MLLISSHGSVVQNFKNWIALLSFRQAQTRGPQPAMPFQNLPKTANYPKIKRVLPSFCPYQKKEREMAGNVHVPILKPYWCQIPASHSLS